MWACRSVAGLFDELDDCPHCTWPTTNFWCRWPVYKWIRSPDYPGPVVKNLSEWWCCVPLRHGCNSSPYQLQVTMQGTITYVALLDLEGFTETITEPPLWLGDVTFSRAGTSCHIAMLNPGSVKGHAVQSVRINPTSPFDLNYGAAGWELQIWMKRLLGGNQLVWRGFREGMNTPPDGQFRRYPPPVGHIGFYCSKPEVLTYAPSCLGGGHG